LIAIILIEHRKKVTRIPTQDKQQCVKSFAKTFTQIELYFSLVVKGS